MSDAAGTPVDAAPAEPPIKLTEKAAAKVKEIRGAENVPPEKALRVCIRGGGCSGFSYDLFFDESKPEIDRQFTLHGVDVIIDQMSLMYLAGTTIDWVDGLQGAGFKFDNPNIKSTCGCGSSFSA